MVLVGPSLGAAVAIDFAVNYPEAVSLSSMIYLILMAGFAWWLLSKLNKLMSNTYPYSTLPPSSSDIESLANVK